MLAQSSATRNLTKNNNNKTGNEIKLKGGGGGGENQYEKFSRLLCRATNRTIPEKKAGEEGRTVYSIDSNLILVQSTNLFASSSGG